MFFSIYFSTKAFSQTSEQGVWLPTRGQLNVLLVYAEALSDPAYWDHRHDAWQPGQMPNEPERYFDHPDSTGVNGYVTGYFHLASYASFNVRAKVFPRLVQIEHEKAAYQSIGTVAKALNQLYPNEAKNLNLEGLDTWTPQREFEPKINAPDSLIDVVVVIWRVNSKISDKNNTGYCAPNNTSINFLGFKGINCFSEFQSWDNSAIITLRHELSHAIFGGNNFHTGGAGAGTRTFIPSVSGYSMLNSWDSHSNGFNGWDRDRLGWKNPNKKFVTSAFKKTQNGLVEHSFESNGVITENATYAIRNFTTSGDAVRLRLPGPDSPSLKQYLWLEYHVDTGDYDYGDTARHGVYAYIQVGKDDKRNLYSNGTTSPGNFTFPLPASGRWDLVYNAKDSTLNKSTVRVDSSRPNPISGHHLLMRPMDDSNNDGKLDRLFLAEVLVDDNGNMLRDYPAFGGRDDAFKPSTQTSINISTNPSTNSLITHNAPNNRRKSIDADTSFITGLDVQISDTVALIGGVLERCAAVKVRWNNFKIENDARWCGTVALKPIGSTKPKLTVDSCCVLLLDRSFTPMHEKLNTLDTLNGQFYFSPLTTLTLYSGTQLILKKGSTLKIAAGSTLYVRKGAKLVFEEGASLEAENGSVVYLD